MTMKGRIGPKQIGRNEFALTDRGYYFYNKLVYGDRSRNA